MCPKYEHMKLGKNTLKLGKNTSEKRKLLENGKKRLDGDTQRTTRWRPQAFISTLGNKLPT